MKRLVVFLGLVFVVGVGSLALAADAGTIALFNKNCSSCHGKDGKGKTKMGEKLSIKDLTDPEVQKEFTDAEAKDFILNGIKKEGKEVMKGRKDKLKPAEVDAIVAYVREFNGK